MVDVFFRLFTSIEVVKEPSDFRRLFLFAFPFPADDHLARFVLVTSYWAVFYLLALRQGRTAERRRPFFKMNEIVKKDK
jgi:hypothetical protein